MDAKHNLMTIRQLAEFLGMKPHTIYQYRADGKSLPPAIKLGHSVRFRVEDVELWLQGYAE